LSLEKSLFLPCEGKKGNDGRGKKKKMVHQRKEGIQSTMWGKREGGSHAKRYQKRKEPAESFELKKIATFSSPSTEGGRREKVIFSTEEKKADITLEKEREEPHGFVQTEWKWLPGREAAKQK